ncbi:putative ribonuclease H-like domain-containing protein, partial [Tanacetum coccineum]
MLKQTLRLPTSVRYSHIESLKSRKGEYYLWYHEDLSTLLSLISILWDICESTNGTQNYKLSYISLRVLLPKRLPHLYGKAIKSEISERKRRSIKEQYTDWSWNKMIGSMERLMLTCALFDSRWTEEKQKEYKSSLEKNEIDFKVKLEKWSNALRSGARDTDGWKIEDLDTQETHHHREHLPRRGHLITTKTQEKWFKFDLGKRKEVPVGTPSRTPQTVKKGNPKRISDYAIIDSGCSEYARDKDKAPRKDCVYSLDLKTLIPSGVNHLFGCKGNKDEAVPMATEDLGKSTSNDPTSWLKAICKFRWVVFLAYKDEHMICYHDLIVGLWKQAKTKSEDHQVRSMEHRTPQQNGVAERKNRTLIEAARTMLADSLLPIQFWAEAVNTACYVLNRVLIIWVFDGKSEEGYLLGYSTNSKGFRVYNRVTRKVQDCLHVNFLENQENQKGKGPDWMFDLDLLTPSMNYIPVRKENYVDSKEQGISILQVVSELSLCIVHTAQPMQFIVHTAQPMHPEERTAAKEVPLSSAKQALHDELVSLMHQESLAKAHNDDQRIAFEEEKKRIALDKGKECVDSTFTLSTANTPPQSTGNTPTDSDDDTPKDGVFSTNSFDAEVSHLHAVKRIF